MDRSSRQLQPPGARRFGGAAELSARFLFKPFIQRMYHGGLQALNEGLGVIPSTAASGSAKPSGSGQAPSALDFGVRYGGPIYGQHRVSRIHRCLQTCGVSTIHRCLEDAQGCMGYADVCIHPGVYPIHTPWRLQYTLVCPQTGGRLRAPVT